MTEQRYRVTAPNPEYSGVTGGCQFAKGVYEGPVAAGPLAYMRGAGYSVEEQSEPAVESPVPEPPQGPVLPAKSAHKADWVQAVVDAALADDPDVDEAEARAAAEAMTKEQLIQLFTEQNPEDQS